MDIPNLFAVLEFQPIEVVSWLVPLTLAAPDKEVEGDGGSPTRAWRSPCTTIGRNLKATTCLPNGAIWVIVESDGSPHPCR